MTVECPSCHAANNVAGLRLPEPWRMNAVEPVVKCWSCKTVFTPKEPKKESDHV